MIGILGGTFDPIHIGHLRSAVDIKQALGFDEIRLVPCHIPPHKDHSVTASADRLAMVSLSVSDESGLVVDDRELNRDGPSYTVDTLKQIRDEVGDAESICLIMGTDAFERLDSWHDWQQLTELAHIIVMERPDQGMILSPQLTAFYAQRKTDDPQSLKDRSAGTIYITKLIQLPVSATLIRQAVSAGESIRYLVPDSVSDYIDEHQLYQSGN